MAQSYPFDLRQKLASGARALWAGEMPPVPAMQRTLALYDLSQDYRLPPTEHQQYDLVYLVERDLGTQKAWPLIIDEGMRLLAPGGVIVVRMTNTPLCSIFALKHQIFQFGDVEPVLEFSCADGATEFAVRNTRQLPRATAITGVSIGVITDGKRADRLNSFIASVRDLRCPPDVEVELLVCGPPEIEPALRAEYPDVVFVTDGGAFAEQGWITHKKNQLVEAATHENLVIAHDRYTFAVSFVEELVSFGGDWSVLVCRQEQPDGRRYPDWVSVGSAWNWSSPAMLEYGDWNPHMYVNGGVTIGKRAVLKQQPWNDLLFWNQAEDVELTRRLMQAGHVPRLARRMVAVSHVMRAGTMEAFEPLSSVPDRYHVPGPPRVTGEVITPSVEYGQPISLGTRNRNEVARRGVFRCEQWQREAEALTLASGRYGEIGFRLPNIPQQSMVIAFALGSNNTSLEVLVNDVPQVVEQITEGVVRVLVDAKRWATSRITRVHLRVQRGSLRVEGLQVEPVGWSVASPLPVSRELVAAFALRAATPPGIDGSSLCLGDANMLVRAARRVAVLLPETLPDTIQLAAFMASLRAYVRPDAVITVVGEADLLALFDGFEPIVVDWKRCARDRTYLTERNAALTALVPELIINACSPRPLLFDAMILECPGAMAIGFVSAGYELQDNAVDFMKPRYTRLLPDDDDLSTTLCDALTVCELPGTFWPEPESQAHALSLLSGIEPEQPVLAVLGDNPARLAAPDFSGVLAGFVERGWILVGIGGPETRNALQRTLSRYGASARNCGGTASVPVVFSLLQSCEGFIGGSPELCQLAHLAGCSDALELLEHDTGRALASVGGGTA